MTMKRYRIISIVFLLTFVVSIGTVLAADHRLESLDINVYINSDGSARIKEHRVANLVEGTESYIVIENLGISKIEDFVVYGDGIQFQDVGNWDIDLSREQKANKSGMRKTSNGYELNWGIGDYGKHEYDLEYTITDFVEQLDDSQMIYWRFVNPDTNIPPEKVSVTISSDNEFSNENEKIWGFGFPGDINFLDGKIVASSDRSLSRSHHVTLLVKLPMGMFATNKILSKTFEDVQGQAFIGSDYDQGVSQDGGFVQDRPLSRNPIMALFRFISTAGAGLFVLIFAILFGKAANQGNKSPVKFTRKFKEEYYRDFPYEGHFLDIYYIPYLMGATNFEQVLTGFILKWINEDRIKTVEEETGWIFKKDSTNLKFLNTEALSNPLENQLFQMMLVAAGKNEILEENEFTRWAKSNSSKIESWEKSIKDSSIKKLEQLGYLEIIEKKVLFFKIPEYVLTETGKELETRIYKYINYLYDFSLLNEHEAINVKLWDNIMIWAGFLGLTEVVAKQFAKLYPRYTQETVYTGNTIFLTSHLASNISHAKIQAARSSGSGGGTSIGGGGGGFSGGGTGGGTR